ncbi:hypothetical protein MBLNU13_g11634t2 [Cladosporium sp. NU13]
MDQFVLFGDSITQHSFSQQNGFAFGAELSDQYARRLDVINRGLSGYNTAQALKVLPQAIPEPQQQNVRLLTIFLGANDSRLPDTPGGPQQNVPLDAFTANLHAILSHKHIAGRPDLRIILITPPPVDERMLRAADSANIPGFNGLRRTADTTAKYAEAVRQVGKDRGVHVCDVWSAMMREAGWDESSTAPLPGSESADENAVLRRFFSDGLHLTPDGYRVLYHQLMALIADTWPDQLPEQLPMVLPAWNELEAWKDL